MEQETILAALGKRYEDGGLRQPFISYGQFVVSPICLYSHVFEKWGDVDPRGNIMKECRLLTERPLPQNKV